LRHLGDTPFNPFRERRWGMRSTTIGDAGAARAANRAM